MIFLIRIREENGNKDSQICSLEAKLHVLKVVNNAEVNHNIPNGSYRDDVRLLQGWLNELEEFSKVLKGELDSCLQLEIPLVADVPSGNLQNMGISTDEQEQRNFIKQPLAFNSSFIMNIRQLKVRLEEWLQLKESLDGKYQTNESTNAE